MSLINKMLKELEKNKKNEEPSHAEVLSSIIPTVKKYNLLSERKILIYVILLIVGISICLHIYKFITEHIKVKSQIPKVALVAKKESLVSKVDLAETKKNTHVIERAILKDIIVRQINDKTVIDFILSAPVQYSIEHSIDQQQLFIALNGTEVFSNLPAVLENTFVIALNTKQNGTSIVCSLRLLPGTKVDDLKIINEQQTKLHLELSNLQLTSSRLLKIPSPVSSEQELARQYQQIQQLLAQNDMREAITKLHLFVGDFANHLQAREILVALLIKENNVQRADDVLTVGLNRKPNYMPFIKLKVRILAEQGKVDAAINLLQRYSSSFMDDSECLAMLAVLYQQKEEFMQAAKLYNQLTKLQPQKTAWWIGLGVALESLGKKNAAKEAYQRAYSSSDATPDLIMFLADKVKE